MHKEKAAGQGEEEHQRTGNGEEGVTLHLNTEASTNTVCASRNVHELQSERGMLFQ